MRSPSVPAPPRAAAKRRVERLADLFGRASILGLADPGVELMRPADPKRVAVAHTTQRHLELAHAVTLSGAPGEGHVGAMSLAIIPRASCGLVAKLFSSAIDRGGSAHSTSVQVVG